MEHLVDLSRARQFPMCGPCIFGILIGVAQGDQFRGQTVGEVLIEGQFLPGGSIVDVPYCEPYVIGCPEKLVPQLHDVCYVPILQGTFPEGIFHILLRVLRGTLDLSTVLTIEKVK